MKTCQTSRPGPDPPDVAVTVASAEGHIAAFLEHPAGRHLQNEEDKQLTVACRLNVHSDYCTPQWLLLLAYNTLKLMALPDSLTQPSTMQNLRDHLDSLKGVPKISARELPAGSPYAAASTWSNAVKLTRGQGRALPPWRVVNTCPCKAAGST